MRPRSKDIHSLVKRNPRAARKRGHSVGKLQYGGSQPVDVNCRIAIDVSEHAQWLRVVEEPRQRDRVAADVHQSAAAHVSLIAYVLRVVVEVRKLRVDRTQLADAAVANQLASRLPLRMEAIHECFHDFQCRMCIGGHG